MEENVVFLGTIIHGYQSVLSVGIILSVCKDYISRGCIFNDAKWIWKFMLTF